MLARSQDRMTMISPSDREKQDRDARLATGMETGAGETSDRLDEHLATMA